MLMHSSQHYFLRKVAWVDGEAALVASSGPSMYTKGRDLCLGVSPSSPPMGRERIATWWHYCDAYDSENVHAETPSSEVKPMATLEFSLIMDFLMYFKLIVLDKISCY